MKINKSIRLWYAVTFFKNAAFILPIWVIFNTDVLGLNNTQAFLLGVLPYGLSAFFEVPTGSWADKYGRAMIFQIGTFFYILSVGAYLVVGNFYILLLLQILGAIGIAMQSGGLEALVHDSIKAKDKDSIYENVYSGHITTVFISRIITVLLGGVLYSINPRGPFLFAVAFFTVALILSFSFKDVRVETPTELSSLEHIKETAKLMWNVKLIVSIMTLIILYRYTSEALFALFQPYFSSLEINVSKFGVFYALISAFSALGSIWIGRALQKINVFKILLGMIAAVTFTSVALLLRVPVLTYLVIIPSSFAFGCALTIMNTTIQKAISSRHQATALSIASFINTGAFFLAVMSIGFSLDHTSVYTTNLFLAGITGACIIPFIVSARKNVKLANK